MISVMGWYALGIILLIVFVSIIIFYVKTGQSQALGPILSLAVFFVVLDFIFEYDGINGTNWGYPNTMYYVFGVPIEMLTISLGAGAAMGAIIWELWPKRGKPVKWGSTLLIAMGTFGFFLYILDIGVNPIIWIFMPWAIWGTIVIMKHKRGLMPWVLLIGMIGMILDGVLEWYFITYSSVYWWKNGPYDFWYIAPCYFLMAIIGGGVIVSLIVRSEMNEE